MPPKDNVSLQDRIKRADFYSTNVYKQDVPVVAEVNAAKIVVNIKNSDGTAVLKNYVLNYEKKIVEPVGNDTYKVGTGKFKTTVSLKGSPNGTVNFEGIEYDGSNFKTCSDDITPVVLGSGIGNVGARHGYIFVYSATLSNHGLTENDIGKTCTIDGETWVLISVPSTSEFVVGCFTNTGVVGLKVVTTPPTTFDFGSSITVTNITRAQLYPSVKNVEINVIKNDTNNFEIAESYDIIAPIGGLNYIINHVGNNENDTVAKQSDAIITVRNLYSFDNSGVCVIYQNLKIIDSSVNIDHYGGSQSMQFGNSDYFSVPLTSYDSLSAAGTEVHFTRSTWNSENIPPYIFCQTDNSGANSNKMFVQGIIMDGRDSFINESGEAGYIFTSRKMYPYAINPISTEEANTTFNIISVRLPIYKNEMDDNFKYVKHWKVGNKYYLFCFSAEAVSGSISLPAELCGKNVETVMAKNAYCINTFTSTVVDIVATGESYLLLKLTD